MAAISDLAWRVFRGFLEGPGSFIFPQHTKEAIFQLSCDLRTNVPKNRKWAYQHGQALKPRSFPGWIAVSSFTFAALSVLSLTSSALLVISLGFASFVTAIASIIGVIVGFWTLVISGSLFASTFFFGGVSACFAAGYVTVTTILNVAAFGQNIVQRAFDSQGSSFKQKISGLKQPLADESIKMQLSPKSPALSSSSTSSSASTGFNKPVSEPPASETAVNSEQSPSPAISLNGHHPHQPGNGNHTDVLEPNSKKVPARENGIGSGVTTPGDGKYKKGKTSFAEIQENLQSFSPRSVNSSLGKTAGKGQAANSISSEVSDTSGVAVYDAPKLQHPATKRSKLENVEAEGNKTGGTSAPSHPVPDLSPGRAEAQHYFADLQKAAKGLTEEETRPESGPSVQGKFAEAVHPKVLGMGEVD